MRFSDLCRRLGRFFIPARSDTLPPVRVLPLELIGFPLRRLASRLCRWAFSAPYCRPWAQCRLISRLMVFLRRLSCLAVSVMVQWRDGYLDMVSFVLGRLRAAHGNLSCRKGRMLPHTGLFLLWKVALQMRIRWPLDVFRFRLSVPVPLCIAAATRWRRLFPFRCHIARRAGSGGRWPFPEPP